MDCPICKDQVPALQQPRKAHLVMHMNGDEHVHVHGDINNKEACQEMLRLASEEICVSMPQKKEAVPTEVVFHNRQRIGDMLMFTCGVRDFKAAYPNVRVNVISTAGHIFDHNPNIDRTLTPTEENTVKIGPSTLTNASNRLDWHFANAYRVSIEEKLGVSIPQGESRPDIWLTQAEWDAPRVFDFPYWIICITGEKGWGCKMYPYEKWQEFVNQNPGIKFVQIGTKEDNPPRLQGDNVIDYVGKTQSKDNGVRDLFKLFLNAEGSIGLVSFHMHLSGALYKPAIVVAGAREPVSFTRYPGHAYLSTDGMLPCAVKACWHCGIDTCTNLIHKTINVQDNDTGLDVTEKIPKCVDIIEPEDLTRALKNFYRGGRLSMDTPSEKPKEFKNIVKTVNPKTVVPSEPKPTITPYGEKFQFKGGSITERDWQFIQDVIQQYGRDEFAKHDILEFGSGLSTLLLADIGCRVLSFETMPGWIKRIKDLKPMVQVNLWDGKECPQQLKDGAMCPIAFVDGPSGGKNREVSTRLAAERTHVLLQHDGWAEWEKKYAEEIIKPAGFIGPFKNGSRTYLWVKPHLDMPTSKLITSRPAEQEKQASEPAISAPFPEELKPVPPSGSDNAYRKAQATDEVAAYFGPMVKHIKIVSTARGWGGCARSVTTIMKKFLAAGHKVDFIPFRNKVTSREFLAELSGPLSEVKVQEEYKAVQEHCDVLLMYADDYIWEFKQPEMQDVFSKIKADRKVMVLNYRRGPVGEVEWTKGWDKYMFLNSTQETELLSLLPGSNTKVLAPCTDLEPFFKVKPLYDSGSLIQPLSVVRHSSQGDTKYDKDTFLPQVKQMFQKVPYVNLALLPGPSYVTPEWCDENGCHITTYKRTADPHQIADFLSQGNLFWYSLPPGYMDMGPRVILEAMAAGLPVLADNWGGAKDRVTGETGWLCDSKDDHITIMQNLSVTDLAQMGRNARERARQEFVPEKWLKEILND